MGLPIRKKLSQPGLWLIKLGRYRVSSLGPAPLKRAGVYSQACLDQFASRNFTRVTAQAKLKNTSTNKHNHTKHKAQATTAQHPLLLPQVGPILFAQEPLQAHTLRAPFPERGPPWAFMLSGSQALRADLQRPASTHGFSRPLGHPQKGMVQGPFDPDPTQPGVQVPGAT